MFVLQMIVIAEHKVNGIVQIDEFQVDVALPHIVKPKFQ